MKGKGKVTHCYRGRCCRCRCRDGQLSHGHHFPSPRCHTPVRRLSHPVSDEHWSCFIRHTQLFSFLDCLHSFSISHPPVSLNKMQAQLRLAHIRAARAVVLPQRRVSATKDPSLVRFDSTLANSSHSSSRLRRPRLASLLVPLLLLALHPSALSS